MEKQDSQNAIRSAMTKAGSLYYIMGTGNLNIKFI